MDLLLKSPNSLSPVPSTTGKTIKRELVDEVVLEQLLSQPAAA